MLKQLPLWTPYFSTNSMTLWMFFTWLIFSVILSQGAPTGLALDSNEISPSHANGISQVDNTLTIVTDSMNTDQKNYQPTLERNDPSVPQPKILNPGISELPAYSDFVVPAHPVEYYMPYNSSIPTANFQPPLQATHPSTSLITTDVALPPDFIPSGNVYAHAPALGIPADIAPSSTKKKDSQVKMVDHSNTLAFDAPLLIEPDLTPVPHMVDPGKIGPALQPPVTTTAIELVTTTETVIFNQTATATSIVTQAPITVTMIETVTASPSMTSDYITVTPTPSQTDGTQVSWNAPEHFNDLSAFEVYNPPSAHKNLLIVSGIPASASARSIQPVATGVSKKFGRNWSNASSVLQCLYPSGSINPGNKDAPQGGFQFYATPLPDIGSASTAVLEYSVFFPSDFVWVKGGKLPGFYGGHTGCSGGNAALDCFSTRLMWRNDGVGELYLYAPKDKQTESLCNDPQSVCDAAYGLSVGRGTFTWTAGAWTHAKQTVVLNTPGEQDGTFILEINGKVVISRHDVFYRDSLSADDRPSQTKKTSSKGKGGAGLLGPLLSLHLRDINRASTTVGSSHAMSTDKLPPDPFFGPPAPLVIPSPKPSIPSDSLLGPLLDGLGQLEESIGLLGDKLAYSQLSLPSSTTPSSASASSSASAVPTDDSSFEGSTVSGYSTSSSENPPGFTGLFFSTFFGGHDPGWASPKDQYTWFKDFAISYENPDDDS